MKVNNLTRNSDYATLLNISLDKSMKSGAFHDSETIEDVTRAAVMLMKAIMLDVRDLEPTFIQPDIIEPLHELAMRITAEEELSLIAPIVLSLQRSANLQSKTAH